MMKATLRSAVLLGIAALGMGVASLPAFAEVQNVKVGGDVSVRAFHRECLDLDCGDDNLGTLSSVTNVLESEDNFVMQTTAVNISADLTENVAAFVRLVNERDWDTTSSAESATDVDLSQGYLKLKELFYSPLTVTIGTQPIVWGRGLVLGSNLLPSVVGKTDDRNTVITANEFTDFTSFDALRATLDLSGVTGDLPVTLDAVYIKLDENTSGLPDDTNVMGVNLGTRFDEMNSEVEAYYLNKREKPATDTATGGANPKDGSINTFGLRGSARPAEGASLWGELAYQFGTRGLDNEVILPSGDSTQGWAANFGADYTFTDVATTPKIGGEWKFFSGKDVDAAVTGWQPIAPGYFTTALREFQTRSTVSATAFYPNRQTGVTSGQTNQHELAVFGSLKPIEDLTVNQRLSWFILPVGALPPSSPATAKRESFLGTEWDTMLTYDYTDDVQFGLIYGLFLPGSVFRSATSGVAELATGDDTAQELITSVSVKF